MKRSFLKIGPVWRGIIVGSCVSVLSGFVYIVALNERSSAFYPFAGLAFLGGSLIGGMIAAWKTREHRSKAFVKSSSAVFGLVCVLFAATYLVVPLYARENVELSTFIASADGALDPPAHLKYAVPGKGTGILVTSDAQTAVVAMIDDTGPPSPTTVFLIDKSDGNILRSLRFNDDIIAATIDENSLYIYNDKILYHMNAHTGEFAKTIFSMDNYGGLSGTNNPIISQAASDHWYMETTAVISVWNADGTVRSRRHLTFNCIALGCFISGETKEVTRLRTAKDVSANGKNRPK